MKLSSRKLIILLFGCAGLAALFLLAAGMPGIRFHDSLPPPGLAPSEVGDSVLNIPGSETFLMILFWVFMVTIPVAVIVILISPEARKRFFAQLVNMALLLVVIYFMTRSPAPILEKLEEVAAALTGGGGGQGSISQPPQNSPEWLTWLLSVGVTAMLIFTGYQFWQRWRQRAHPPEISDDLAESAAQALAALRAGREFKEAILRCYQQMVDIAAAEKALPRPEFLTAGEFIAVLEGAGLPAAAVAQLTHLFEFARYSTHQASPEQNAQAIACLETIVQSSRSTA